MRADLVVKDTCPRRQENHEIVEELLDGWFWRDDLLYCDYCGSLQPDMLLSLMATTGCELGPTDKNFKVYVKRQGQHVGKFYFQHFSIENCQRFIELYNQKPRTFTVGYPHHFYVLPFFVALEGRDE
jgi:hypothetical protein